MANKFNQLHHANKIVPTHSSQKIKKTKTTKSRVSRSGWKQQWRHAWLDTLTDMWRQPLTTLLTIIVITISLTLPSLCYLIWKNTNQVIKQWYPTQYLTVYLNKMLDNDAAIKVVNLLKKEDGIANTNYISREEAMNEFRNWSGFGDAMDMLEENPLPALAIITPKTNFQNTETLKALRDRVASTLGVDEVRMDNGWLSRLTALTSLIGKLSGIISLLMIVSVFLVIGNSIHLSIFSRRDTINIMKLIGAADKFILRPFLNEGVLLGLAGALLSLILSELLVSQLKSVVANTATVFGTTFILHGFSWDEANLLLLISATIGWIAARLATAQHLHRFTPE